MSAKLLNNTEVQELMGCNRSTLYRWCKAGKFPAPVTIGGRPKWRESDIEAHIASLPTKDNYRPDSSE